jgi:capsid protein
MAGWVESSEEADSAVVRALERARASGTINDEEMEKILYGDGDQAGIVQGTNYQRIEDLVGGKFEYSDPGDKIHIHESSRPSPQVKDFIDFIQRVSGAAIGLARSRSTMKAETSYTAFRGEELMSWASIEVYQKQLERRLLDFVSYKTINYAIENGEIDPTDSVWIDKISWEWPKMKEVDEGRQVAANQNKLKSGLATYKQLLGPDWEERFAQFAVELNKAKELGLPLGVFESVSGAIVEETKDNNGSDSDVED